MILPRADLNSTRPPAPVETLAPAASATDAREEVLHRLTQIVLGRQLQATVVSMFEDRSFLVRVEGLPLRMALPAGVKSGDTLEMALVAREPRPVFLLTAQQGEAEASLSPAARLVDRLLQAMGRAGTPAALRSPAPLLASPAQANAAQLAAALQDGMEFSGLFYESHLQQWLEGSRPAALLLREPQAHWPSTAPSAPPAPPSHPQAPAGPALAPPAPGSAVPAADAARPEEPTHGALRATGPLLEADAVTAARPETLLEPEAARLMSAQLQALEQRQIFWRGELWPGQPLEWEIAEDKREGSGSAGAAPEQSEWISRMRFELPALGGIAATLRLSGERVNIEVDAGSAGVAAALRAQGGLLAEALAAAGTPLDSLTVKQHGPA